MNDTPHTALHTQLTAAITLARLKRDTLKAILDAVDAPEGDVTARVEWLANEVIRLRAMIETEESEKAA